ncbi:MAG: TIGR01777 family oxidoreductase [Bacteroidota bacterium]
MPVFTRRLAVDVPAERLFAWHDHRGAFNRLTPPWQPVRLEQFEGIRDGQRAEIKLGPGPVALTWVAEHFGFAEGRQFNDRQVRGPFAAWTHAHRMLPDGPARSTLEDHVEYRLPLAPLSNLARGFARSEIDRLFAYRHRVTREDLARHAAYDLAPQTIALTGSTGLLGEALVAFLTTGGHRVVRLVRSPEAVARYADRADETAAYWSPKRGTMDAAALEGVDAVIHLAGENVFGLRWSEAKKQRILESRRQGTRLLAETLAGLDRPPRTLLSASASGFYGDQGDARVTEADGSGEGFLAHVCRVWEAETAPAVEAGVRTVHLRIGLVLTPAGGFLGTMLPAFLLGLGGTVGSGETYLPWIALDDVLYAMLHLLAGEQRGPVNLGAPEPATQRAYTRAMGRVLRRPTFLNVPAPLVRTAAGEVADEMALKSVRMLPEALVNSGFAFAYPDLEPALRHLLGRTA